MTDTMRAIEISQPGGPEVLTETRRPVPEPRAGDTDQHQEVAVLP